VNNSIALFSFAKPIQMRLIQRFLTNPICNHGQTIKLVDFYNKSNCHFLSPATIAINVKVIENNQCFQCSSAKPTEGRPKYPDQQSANAVRKAIERKVRPESSGSLLKHDMTFNRLPRQSCSPLKMIPDFFHNSP
jgi:hypothetical protein